MNYPLPLKLPTPHQHRVRDEEEQLISNKVNGELSSKTAMYRHKLHPKNGSFKQEFKQAFKQAVSLIKSTGSSSLPKLRKG